MIRKLNLKYVPLLMQSDPFCPSGTLVFSFDSSAEIASSET